MLACTTQSTARDKLTCRKWGGRRPRGMTEDQGASRDGVCCRKGAKERQPWVMARELDWCMYGWRKRAGTVQFGKVAAWVSSSRQGVAGEFVMGEERAQGRAKEDEAGATDA
jgi:hypothetical protein|uniref:Uncharacterized protein n=3 Tax=Zea mays TaxID=4577 RepID=A0A804UJ54_MAIZE